MRWQNPNVNNLPPELLEAIANGSYRKAAIGSCPAQDVKGPFTTYRVAVIALLSPSMSCTKRMLLLKAV
jgi:hypothetical protein